MAGLSSTPTFRNGTSLKIRSRSNTDANVDDVDPLDSRPPTPVLTHPDNISSTTNNSINQPPSSTTKRTSLSLQPPTSRTHNRSQSILSQLTNHVRQMSTDASSVENIPSINSNIDSNGNRLSISNLNTPNDHHHHHNNSLSNPNRDLSPIKGKMSPENSPLLSYSVTSPVKVSGVAKGPKPTDVILEINDDLDINDFIHGENSSKIPKLNLMDSPKRGKPLSIRTDTDSLPIPAIITTNIDNDHNSSNDKSQDDDTNIGFFARLNKSYPHMNITIASILLWYAFSMSISVYNRWMFSAEKLDFKYPIIITSFHQLILTLLAILTLCLFPSFRLSRVDYRSLANKELNDDHNNLSNTDEFENNQITYTMPIKEYVTSILPCSIASAGDIGLGNTAFRFITLSLYTMVKTSALIFVLLWGVFFKLEKLTLRIFTIVCIMTFGVGMMVWGQKDGSSDTIKTVPTPPVQHLGSQHGNSLLQYSDIDSGTKIDQLVKRIWNEIRNTDELKSSHLIFIGVSLVLFSACMSGLRWALTQIMLKKNKRTKNPILTMLYISPGMCVFLFLVGAIGEGVGNFINAEIWEVKGVGVTIGLILIPGFLAFFMTLSEYVLLQHASLLTLSIAGIFKELLTIFVSWVVFDDKLSFINIIGLGITFADIIWYNIYRFQQNAEKSKNGSGGNSTRGEDIGNEFVDIELNNMNVR